MPKTIAEKLQIKPGDTVFAASADPVVLRLLEPLPAGTSFGRECPGSEAAVFFAVDRTALDQLLSDHLDALGGVRAPWVAYLKGGRSDLNRDRIWERLQELGWRLVSNVSLSEEWSAVRLKKLDADA